MTAQEWLTEYNRTRPYGCDAELAATIIRALLAENEQLRADRALENDLDLPAGVLTLKRDYEQLKAENEALKSQFVKGGGE